MLLVECITSVISCGCCGVDQVHAACVVAACVAADSGAKVVAGGGQYKTFLLADDTCL